MQTILIVEDEEDILELLEYLLSKVGYKVIGMKDTSKVEKFLDEEECNLILMDRNLPNIEGSLFIKKLRENGYNIPVIYVTAKDSSDDILDGFERGGDDYITKPFNHKELIARVKAVIKRTTKDNKIIKYKDIIYDDISKKVTINGKNIKLTKIQTKLLKEFLQNPNKLFTRDELLESVWDDPWEKQLKTVNIAIKRLREKIDCNGSKNYIKSVRGEGYILC